MPWATWFDEHPDTVVLGGEPRGLFGVVRERFTPDYVIGVTLGDHARAYPYPSASAEGVVNDRLGPFPVVVLVDSQTKAVHVYLRDLGEGDPLDFSQQDDGRLVDLQTGSTWNAARGIAVDGPLKGEVLKQVPYITSYDWAWEDF